MDALPKLPFRPLGRWLLKQSGEPPEVVAGKVESYYGKLSDGGRDPGF